MMARSVVMPKHYPWWHDPESSDCLGTEPAAAGPKRLAQRPRFTHRRGRSVEQNCRLALAGAGFGLNLGPDVHVPCLFSPANVYPSGQIVMAYLRGGKARKSAYCLRSLTIT